MPAPTPPEIAGVLRTAADVIDRNGLAKNGNFYDETSGKPPRECPVCVYGAIDVADDRDPGVGPRSFAASLAAREFSKALGQNVIRWNDDPATTPEQVVTELRRCATWLERTT